VSKIGSPSLGQPTGSADSLPAELLTQLLHWGRGPVGEIPPITVITLFEEQVAQDPHRIALISDDQNLTYGELHQRVDRMARRLASEGVAPEQVVGLSVSRSPAMVAAMLAIWKVGAAWLPLDPRLPPARIRNQITDCQLALAIVDHPRAADWQLPELNVLPLSALDLDSGSTDSGPAYPADDLHRLAYVLFTSGSTGRPKGVEICHGGLTNMLRSMQIAPGCARDDAVLAITTFTFDASLIELFLPLLCGARLVLASAETILDPAAMGALIDRHQIRFVFATPVTWRMLVQSGWRPNHPVRAFCAGEALPDDLAHDLTQRFAELWNGYGPTEDTVCSTLSRVGASADLTSIGRPIHNTSVYLLDEHRRLVAPGKVGELWVGGAGVARGYRGQPELTAQRFVDDPFRGELSPPPLPSFNGGRMYATGDLAQWQPDGTLKFLGRIDHQVKIRGFRIELGEIESLLRAQPGVAGAVVLLSHDGQQRLVAHVVPHPGAAPDPAALRDALRRMLPDYMVPHAIVSLDAFPLTPSGKIDRNALAARDLALPAPTGRPPSSPLELTLARLWCELLLCDSVDCDSSFFDLGGHSLLAARLFARIAQETGRRLPLKVLFEAPTLGDLARLLAATNPTSNDQLLTTIAAGGDRWPLYLLPSASGDILFWRRLIGQLDPAQPLLGLSPRRDHAARVYYESLSAWVEPMVAAIEAHQPTGPIHLLGYSAGGHAAHELARQLEARGRTVGYLGIIDTIPANRVWSLSDRLRHLPEFLRNLAFWTVDNDHGMTWRNLQRRFRRLKSRLVRRLRTSKNNRPDSPEETKAWMRFVAMLQHHHPGRLKAPLHLYRARSQSPWAPVDADLGWKHYCSGTEITVIAGVDHQRIMNPETLPTVAAAIRQALAARMLHSGAGFNFSSIQPLPTVVPR
jgi:amino acid adenylation domain-containing protein